MTVPGASRPCVLLVGLALLAAPGCRSAEERGENEIVSAVQHGQFERAVEEARRLVEANPGDAGAAALYRDAQLALLLDGGRRQVFHWDLEAALASFEQADALAPGHPVVEEWIGKTRTQLAVKWLDIAVERTGPEHLDEAEEAYEKVLFYDPDNTDGRRGLAQVLLLKNYRGGMSKSYFDDGLSSFRELMLDKARREFQVSNRYAANEPATRRGEQVEQMMAEERLAQAHALENSGQYFAARNEYRIVLLVDRTNADARAGLDRMDREVRAARSLAKADMAMRRGELDQAKETIAEAEVLTVAQRDHVSLIESDIEERRLEDMYEEALTLAKDYRYPEAVVAFDALLAVAPDFKDALQRKQTLEEFITLAEDFYARALVASDDAEAEEYLRAIHPVIWPEYKDVVERLAAIEARKPKPEPDPDSDAATDDGGGR